jgi:hypothetical protein
VNQRFRGGIEKHIGDLAISNENSKQRGQLHATMMVQPGFAFASGRIFSGKLPEMPT